MGREFDEQCKLKGVNNHSLGVVPLIKLPLEQSFFLSNHSSGYGKLLELCRRADFFVCTSNIDGAFLRAGFPPERLFEAHGSVHMWQCCDPKCNRAHPPWPAQAKECQQRDIDCRAL